MNPVGKEKRGSRDFVYAQEQPIDLVDDIVYENFAQNELNRKSSPPAKIENFIVDSRNANHEAKFTVLNKNHTNV